MLAMHQKDRTHSIITIPELIENEETARDIEGLKVLLLNDKKSNFII